MNRAIRVAVMAILALGVIASYAAGARRDSLKLTPEDAKHLAARLDAIPLRTDAPAFRGTREVLEPKIVKLSGADHYATINYVAATGGRVRLHVGAASRTDAWFHEPTVCLPGQGWKTISTVRVPIWRGLEGVPDGTQIWRVRLRKKGANMLVYYWLQYGKHVVTTKAERRWLRFNDLMKGIKDRPAQIVILYAPVGVSESHSEKLVESLVRAIWSRLFEVLSSGG